MRNVAKKEASGLNKMPRGCRCRTTSHTSAGRAGGEDQPGAGGMVPYYEESNGEKEVGPAQCCNRDSALF
jgi:hypothetical protein